MKRSILLLVPCVVLAGCENFLFRGADCTTQSNIGVLVYVVDSVSGVPRGGGALVSIKDGVYVESFRGETPVEGRAERKEFDFAWERKGTYEVTVTRDGYATWQKSGVKVSADECHVRTAEVTARLKALP